MSELERKIRELEDSNNRYKTALDKMEQQWLKANNQL